ncbi:MAG: prephenate dehydrogenase [Bacteroidales bacterium]|nr:prephenate dehydrogenase [Bacteroidales bacterium]
MNVGVIGLGLIGGSLAIDLRKRGFAEKVLGVENDRLNAEAALKIGLADEIVDLEACVAASDVIVIAIPVGAAVQLLTRVLDLVAGTEKVVLDVCSVKESLCQVAVGHKARKQYVATHPMAGTEYSGPWAAMPGLFDGRACIFCDIEESSPKAVRLVEKIYDVLNMRVTFMRSDAHDMHVAYVSHISHITSFALALTVLDKEKDEKHIFDLASGGFSSTVRLAKSSADMWVPILAQNHDNVLRVIDTYIDKMKEFREAIDAYDEARIRELIEEGNKIKRIIR